ncbi:hypothetical protein T4D_4430 [Trichinella pseudospiralis]|uniref:Uncharacterized protein n=1 Tax=Trichinella pseudospiralis TaxID=6337 RepID=A0A0V1FAQ0_TRIPS|nr:hypothetical protein T4D_4430 [Trichinella pseudospiralis]
MLTRCSALFACIDRKQKEVCQFQGGQKEALAFVGEKSTLVQSSVFEASILGFKFLLLFTSVGEMNWKIHASSGDMKDVLI